LEEEVTTDISGGVVEKGPHVACIDCIHCVGESGYFHHCHKNRVELQVPNLIFGGFYTEVDGIEHLPKYRIEVCRGQFFEQRPPKTGWQKFLGFFFDGGQ
jgi:hypothetical protein